MTKQEVLNALDVIEKEYQTDIQETQARFNKLKQEVYQIPDLSAKYKADSFTEKEAAIVDEYEDLIDWPFLCLQRKDEKIRALKDRIENEAKEISGLIDNVNYSNVLQGTAINSLSKVKAKNKDFNFDELIKIGKTTQKIGNTEFTVIIKNFNENSKIRTSMHKLLTALLIEFTETGSKDTKITLSLDKYMKMCGLKNKVAARRAVNEDLEILYNLSISFTQNIKDGRKKKPKNYMDMRLVVKKGIMNGIITCHFFSEFYELMKTYKPMPIHKKTLTLDDRYNPHAFYFLKKLCEHVNMNYGKDNQNIISVASLLASSPEMPTYEDVQANKNRKYKQFIIEPFRRDMNKLIEIQAVTWEYDNKDCEQTWDSFIKANVHFELIDYPVRALKDEGLKHSKHK